MLLQDNEELLVPVILLHFVFVFLSSFSFKWETTLEVD